MHIHIIVFVSVENPERYDVMLHLLLWQDVPGRLRSGQWNALRQLPGNGGLCPLAYHLPFTLPAFWKAGVTAEGPLWTRI